MALVVSVRILGLSMIIPIISAYGFTLTDSSLLIGLAVGGYGVTQAIFQIPYGRASDRWGRKRLIILGMLIFSAGSILGGFADNITLLIAARILQGGGAVTATVFAFIHDVVDPNRRNLITALIGAPIGVFFGLGVAVGPLAAEAYGVPKLFFFSGILGFLITVYLIFAVREDIPPDRKPVSGELVAFRELVFDVRLLRIYIAGFLMSASVTSIFFLMPLILGALFGLEMRELSYVYIPMIGITIAVMILFSRFADWGYTRTAIIVGFGLLLLGSIGMIYGTGLYFFAAAATVAFAGVNSMEPILPIFVGKVANQSSVGSAMGIYSTIQFSGSFVGALLIGLLLPYGFTAGLSALGVLACIGLIVSFPMKNPMPSTVQDG